MIREKKKEKEKEKENKWIQQDLGVDKDSRSFSTSKAVEI